MYNSFWKKKLKNAWTSVFSEQNIHDTTIVYYKFSPREPKYKGWWSKLCKGALFPGLATLVHGLHCTAGTSLPCALEVVPGASSTLRLSHLSVGGNATETGDCGPARHVGAGRWGLLGPTAHGLLGRRHPGPRLSYMVGRGWDWKYRDSRILGGGGLASAEFPKGAEFQGSLAPFFSPHP